MQASKQTNKQKYRENFSGPPFRPQKKKKKKKGGPLFGMKIMDQPHRKVFKLYFH